MDTAIVAKDEPLFMAEVMAEELQALPLVLVDADTAVHTVRNTKAQGHQRGMNMNKLAFSLLAGGLFVSGA